MPSIPYCTNGTRILRALMTPVNPSLPGSPIPALPLSACNYQQTAGGKRQVTQVTQENKEEEESRGCCSRFFSRGVQCLWYLYGCLWTCFSVQYICETKGRKTITVTQATIDYVKMKGADVINGSSRMDTATESCFQRLRSVHQKASEENRMVILSRSKEKR